MLISRSKQFRNQVQNCIGKAGLEKMHRLQVAHLSLKFCLLTWAFWNANLKGWWAHQWTIRSITQSLYLPDPKQYLIAKRICKAFAYLHIFQDLNLLHCLLASYSATAFHQVLTANLPALQQQLLPWLEAATSMRLEMLSFSKSFLVKRNPAKWYKCQWCLFWKSSFFHYKYVHQRLHCNGFYCQVLEMARCSFYSAARLESRETTNMHWCTDKQQTCHAMSCWTVVGRIDIIFCVLFLSDADTEHHAQNVHRLPDLDTQVKADRLKQEHIANNIPDPRSHSAVIQAFCFKHGHGLSFWGFQSRRLHFLGAFSERLLFR